MGVVAFCYDRAISLRDWKTTMRVTEFGLLEERHEKEKNRHLRTVTPMYVMVTPHLASSCRVGQIIQIRVYQSPCGIFPTAEFTDFRMVSVNA